MSAGDAEEVRRFGWVDTLRVVAGFAHEVPSARAADDGSGFAADGVELRLPLLAPRTHAAESPRDYLARVGELPERHVVVLLRAGAMAIGYWQGEELLRHKAQKRYVVRGNGKAQPTHLKTRGKSRYGSRLRLQNWQLLLQDVTSRLTLWWRDLGAPDQVHYAAATRVWTELVGFDKPSLPFDPDGADVRRIPRTVHEPTHGELLRVRQLLARGVVRPRPPGSDDYLP
jgi:hypothetical protein